MKEIEQELNEALFKVDRVNKRPDHQLMEEFVVCKWNGG